LRYFDSVVFFGSSASTFTTGGLMTSTIFSTEEIEDMLDTLLTELELVDRAIFKISSVEIKSDFLTII
jgi:transcription termination factor NusB